MSVYMYKEQYEKVRRMAYARRISKSQFVRDLIDAAAEQVEYYDRQTRTG